MTARMAENRATKMTAVRVPFHLNIGSKLDLATSLIQGLREYLGSAWNTRGQGVILSSPDGTLWISHSTGSAALLDADTYGNGRFVVVGQGGTILKSQSVVRLGPLTFLQNGPAQFAVTGASGWTYPIEASSNLTAWVTLTNVALTNDTGQFTDWSTTSFSQRFYRAVAQ